MQGRRILRSSSFTIKPEIKGPQYDSSWFSSSFLTFFLLCDKLVELFVNDVESGKVGFSLSFGFSIFIPNDDWVDCEESFNELLKSTSCDFLILNY